MKQHINIEETELEGDYGGAIPSVSGCCPECGAEAEAYGQHDGSIRAVCVMIAKQCSKRCFVVAD